VQSLKAVAGGCRDIETGLLLPTFEELRKVPDGQQKPFFSGRKCVTLHFSERQKKENDCILKY
jgi:hypothetical protein